MSIISVSKRDLEEMFAKELLSLWELPENEVIGGQVDELYYLIGRMQLDTDSIITYIEENVSAIKADNTEYIRQKNSCIERIRREFEDNE